MRSWVLSQSQLLCSSADLAWGETLLMLVNNRLEVTYPGAQKIDTAQVTSA
jgi:hypothetical protein